MTSNGDLLAYFFGLPAHWQPPSWLDEDGRDVPETSTAKVMVQLKKPVAAGRWATIRIDLEDLPVLRQQFPVLETL